MHGHEGGLPGPLTDDTMIATSAGPLTDEGIESSPSDAGYPLVR